jgi:hypothetical protein
MLSMRLTALVHADHAVNTIFAKNTVLWNRSRNRNRRNRNFLTSGTGTGTVTGTVTY